MLKIILTVILAGLCIFDLGAAEETITKDSAIVLAFDYLGSKMPTEKKQLKKVKCRGIHIKNDRSPYFRQFLNGRNAWVVKVPETVVAFPFDRANFDRPYSEFIIYIEKESGLLLKITYDFDKLKLSKEKFDDFEEELNFRSYRYIGPMKIKPAPFLEIAGRGYVARAFVGFPLDVEAADGTLKHYWHLVMYEAPYMGSYPPPIPPRDGKPQRSQYHYGPPPKIREDNIFDGVTGKSLRGRGYRKGGI